MTIKVLFTLKSVTTSNVVSNDHLFNIFLLFFLCRPIFLSFFFSYLHLCLSTFISITPLHYMQTQASDGGSVVFAANPASTSSPAAAAPRKSDFPITGLPLSNGQLAESPVSAPSKALASLPPPSLPPPPYPTPLQVRCSIILLFHYPHQWSIIYIFLH